MLWVQSLVSTTPRPDWLNIDDLPRRPVVVRRAPMHADQIPVGVRGSSRSERYGCHVASAAIIRRITPEQLVNQKRWRKLLQDQTSAQCQAQENHCPQWATIELIDEILQYYGIVWGMTGSCGFELATGLKTVTPTVTVISGFCVRSPWNIHIFSTCSNISVDYLVTSVNRIWISNWKPPLVRLL
ncbi:malonate decarboxylase holo-[acyl-carrier-protein] synthase [Vibrio sp. PP-XX7]